jgi:hypothetical protein
MWWWKKRRIGGGGVRLQQNEKRLAKNEKRLAKNEKRLAKNGGGRRKTEAAGDEIAEQVTTSAAGARSTGDRRHDTARRRQFQ